MIEMNPRRQLGVCEVPVSDVNSFARHGHNAPEPSNAPMNGADRALGDRVSLRSSRPKFHAATAFWRPIIFMPSPVLPMISQPTRSWRADGVTGGVSNPGGGSFMSQSNRSSNRRHDEIGVVDAADGAISDENGDLMTTHAPDGAFTFVSGNVRDLTGYDACELDGRAPRRFVHPGDLRRLATAHRTLLERPGIVRIAFRVRTKDRGFAWFETTAFQVPDRGSDKPLEIFASTRKVARGKGVASPARNGARRARVGDASTDVA